MMYIYSPGYERIKNNNGGRSGDWKSTSSQRKNDYLETARIKIKKKNRRVY